jgi:hypothetical protein
MEASLFKNVYKNIRLLDESLEGNIFKMTYKIEGSNKKGVVSYDAYSYFRPSDKDGPKATCAALIIPGSDRNQASKIFRKDFTNYQGNITGITEKYCDTFVFVKPNEDFLAIHDGKNRLSYDFYVNYLLNNDGSYSATYIAHSLAITKYLKKRYGKVFVFGLSQGGHAALLNAVQSKPTAAVVASGYTLLYEKLRMSGYGQIVIPGLVADFGPEKLFSIIKNSDTRYLFTFGKGDEGVCRIEAEEGYVCDFFEPLSNVSCQVHDGAHIYPDKIVDDFMASHVSEG